MAEEWSKPPAYEEKTEAFNPLMAQSKLEALRRVAEQYEMAAGAIAKLRLLEGYDIVLIVDDSSSMAQPAREANLNAPFAPVPSRWDELKQRTIQIMDVACCLDQDGIDLYFLNRPPAFNVHERAAAEALFASPPVGYTPLSACYTRVLNDKLRRTEKRVFVIIATDGEPNKNVKVSWVKDTAGFEALLKDRAGYPCHRCPTSIMACTDSEYEIGWLNRVDNEASLVDVVDDFESERKEIMRIQGSDFRFTQGDYVVKTMLGPLVRLYDDMDERKLTREELADYLGVDLRSIPRRSQCENCVLL